MKNIRRFEDIDHFDITTDILIAGFGGAGACAAIEARRAGSEVLVLEWSSGPGGSTALSACEMYLGGSGGTRLQRDVGVSDSTENFYNYLMACFEDVGDPARMRAFAEGAAEHFDWVESMGITYNRSVYWGRDVVAMTDDSLMFTGNERVHPFNTKADPVPRGHLAGGAGHDGGKVVMAAIVKNVEKEGADRRFDARVIALIQDKDGRVRGAVARIDNQETIIAARQGVILTCGGFIMNEQMTGQHIPRLASLGTRHGNPGDMGDGIVMGLAAGGHAINMGEAFYGIATYPPAEMTYGILLNDKAQRFVNEDSYLARIGIYASYQQSDQIYMFMDNRHFGRPDYVQNTEIVAVGETVAEVEQDSGLPEGALRQTVAYYNLHAANGEDPLFHKAANWLQPFDTPPYALVSYKLSNIKPHVFTLGGLDTLPTGEVLTPQRAVIPGLYAAGRTAAGIPRSARGYASGMSVADATYFGRMAGRQAAKAPRWGQRN
jgi:succinate dehydrogenase/fumarate reductase flavoprotein subunit